MVQLTLVIGQHAMAWHLPSTARGNLTETVRAWREHWPDVLPLPHPSPRNNIWLKANPWFALEVIPAVQARIRSLIASESGAAAPTRLPPSATQ